MPVQEARCGHEHEHAQGLHLGERWSHPPIDDDHRQAAESVGDRGAASASDLGGDE